MASSYLATPLNSRKVSLYGLGTLDSLGCAKGNICQSDLEFLRQFEIIDVNKTVQVFEHQSRTSADVLLKFIENSDKLEVVEYCLFIVRDILEDKSTSIQYFMHAHTDILINRAHDGAIGQFSLWLLACHFLLQLGANGLVLTGEQLQRIMDTFTPVLMNDDRSIRLYAIQVLQKFLEKPESRNALAHHSTIMAILESTLRAHESTFQVRYDIVFCIWLMTFEAEAAKEMVLRGMIKLLLELTRSSVKEKNARICLAALRNIAVHATKQAAAGLSDHRTLGFINGLLSRRWSDEDVVLDLQFLSQAIETNRSVIESSFCEYAAELRSGMLEWNTAHSSAMFWQQHATKLNDNDFELLRMLVVQLIESTSVVTLSVAAHDLGEYVRFHTKGKQMVQQLGGKTRLMELLHHPEPKVRSEALLAIQKYMVTNWQELVSAGPRQPSARVS